MTREFIATIPIPPSANRYWMVANNRMVVTNEARNYKSALFYKLSPMIDEPMRGDVCVNMTVFRQSRRGDLDNYNKVLFDALQGIVYLNDSQIVEIHTFRQDDKYNPRVELLVYEVA